MTTLEKRCIDMHVGYVDCYDHADRVPSNGPKRGEQVRMCTGEVVLVTRVEGFLSAQFATERADLYEVTCTPIEGRRTTLELIVSRAPSYRYPVSWLQAAGYWHYDERKHA